jgi:hypothetical protein
MRRTQWMVLPMLLCVCLPIQAAPPAISFDGRILSLSAENQSVGQLLSVIQKSTGLRFEAPGELQSMRLPLVEITKVSVREALLRLLEGTNYDYILVAVPGDPDRIQTLLIPGKSTKIAATSAGALRGQPTHAAVEDVFGGGGDPSLDENPGIQPDPVNNVQQPPQPGVNMPPQGVTPVQPGVTPVQPGVTPVQPGVSPNGGTVQPMPQQQTQPQNFQPFNPYNQNGRRPF